MAGFLAAAGMLLAPIAAAAAEFKTGDEATFVYGEEVHDDLYMAGGTVSSGGAVRGDGIFAGGTVLVSGSVGGDLMAAGGTLTVLNGVTGDARLAGGTVIVQGGVGEDLVVAGGEVTVAGPGVKGDAVLAGGHVVITAPIIGDVKVYGNDVLIDTAVSGNVSVHAEKVTLGEHAVIGGNFVYSAPAEASIAGGARVAGETSYTKTESREVSKKKLAATLGAVATAVFFGKFLAIFVGALVIAYGLRRFTKEVVARSTSTVWATLGHGLVLLIMLPVVSVLLFVTIIGIPLGALGLIAFAGLMLVGNLLAPIVIGAWVHTRVRKPHEYVIDWKTILLGTVIFMVLGLIPLIGWVIRFLVVLAVLGALWTIKREAIKAWR